MFPSLNFHKVLNNLNLFQVRQTAQAALIAIVERGILSKKQLEYEICPVILKMTYMQIEFLNTAIVVSWFFSSPLFIE